MTILQAIILGIVQGLTEFLPISSSGHLLLVEHVFGISEGNLFFNILLHIASLLAVIIVMRKEIWELIKRPFSKQTLSVIYCSIITVIVVLLLSFSMDKFTSIGYLGFGFLISAVLILFTYILGKRKNTHGSLKRDIGYIDSIIIGLVQGFATLPGISRSGSTICTALLLGNDRTKSANFSFIISIPIIIGAMLFEILKGGSESVIQVPAISSIIGFFVSFVVAVFSIKLMNKVVHKGSWLGFSIYLFILSLVVLLNQYVFMWI